MLSLKGASFALILAAAMNASAQPVRLVIAGLTHGHVSGFLHALQGRQDVDLVGIYDPDFVLEQGYAQQFHLANELFSTDLGGLLDRAKPDAVAIFSSTYDHPGIVETCTAHHVRVVMMEKPLAIGVREARRIERAAASSGAQIIVNYETTWYPSQRGPRSAATALVKVTRNTLRAKSTPITRQLGCQRCSGVMANTARPLPEFSADFSCEH